MGTTRAETLTKANFETWRILTKALLIKNDAWIYVSGSKPKPEIVKGDAKSKDDFDKWIEMDEKEKQTLYCVYLHQS